MIKFRTEEKSNYKSVWFDGKTVRFAINPRNPILELEYPEFYDVKLTGKCSFGKCKYCLTEESKISTINGNISIKDIKIGDNVFTMNKNYEFEICEVEQIYSRKYYGELINIELDNGNIISMTPDHEIYTRNRGWIKSSDLNEQDILLEI
jgi:hypothetical protein